MMVSKTIRLGSNPSTDAKMNSIMQIYGLSIFDNEQKSVRLEELFG
jgi:hypothetical protein